MGEAGPSAEARSSTRVAAALNKPGTDGPTERLGRGRRWGHDALAVDEGADASRGMDLASGGRVRDPRGLSAPLIDEGDHASERLLAVDKVAGAVDGVDHPAGARRAHDVEQSLVGGSGLLAHDWDVDQLAQRRREHDFGVHVGVGDEIPIGRFGADFVCRQRPPSGHDLGGCGVGHRGENGVGEGFGNGLGSKIHVSIVSGVERGAGCAPSMVVAREGVAASYVPGVALKWEPPKGRRLAPLGAVCIL